MFDYGKQEGISLAQKEELEFLKDLKEDMKEDDLEEYLDRVKQRISQLEKGRERK